MRAQMVPRFLLLFFAFWFSYVVRADNTPCADLFKDAVALGPKFMDEPSLLVCYLGGQRPSPALGPLAVAYYDQHSARTDQQVGASNSSAGATITEKTGISDLLTLAVEHGAITRSSSASAVTLQTTPYLFFTGFGGADSPENWSRLTFLRHLGLTATFSTDTPNTATGLGNFEQAEAKYIVLGNRSNRDSALTRKIQAELDTVLAPLLSATACTQKVLSAYPAEYVKARTLLRAGLESQAGLTENALIQVLEAATTDLRARVALTDVAQFRACAGIIAHEVAVSAAVANALEIESKAWEAAKPPLQLAVSYAYVRDVTVVDYSRCKVLLGYVKPGVLSANLNVDVTLNNSLVSGTGASLERVRNYALEASLTLGRFANNAVDLGFALQYQRDRMISLDKKYWQVATNLYLVKGVTIPLSVTYTNHADDTGTSQTRFSIGLALNADAFLGVSNQRQF